MEVLYSRHKSQYPEHYVTGELGVPLDIPVQAWQIHCYTFGSAFTLASFFILLSIFRLIQDGREKKFMRRNYFLLVNLALFYFTLPSAITPLLDPFEDRRFMRPRALRQGIQLLIRLRLPCLAVAFSLIQVSLLTITELHVYVTRFHNTILIFTLNLIYFALVIISTGSSMLIANYAAVWLTCDLYMFFLFFSYNILSLCTGIKIIVNYQRGTNKFLKILTATGSLHGRTDYLVKSGDQGETNHVIIPTEQSDITTSLPTEQSDINTSPNTETCTTSDISKNENISSMFPKRTSLLPVYVDPHKEDQKHRKIICRKRRMGSMPYQNQTSKFEDKSIRKVTILMVIVAICGLVLCIGIVIALWSAAWFDGHNLEGWAWYVMRTVLRGSELGATGVMAYMVRRVCCC